MKKKMYNDGHHPLRVVHRVREIDLKNFHPMVHNILIKNKWNEKYCQVLVDTVGGQHWITINKSEVQEV